MTIYAISIFLDKEPLSRTLEYFKDNNIILKEAVEEDQTGQKESIWCGKLNEINFTFVKSNSFHKNMDFEIGLTLKTKEEAETFFESLDKSDYEVGIFGEDNFMYGIPKGKPIHGPFFFNYDNGKYSDIQNLKSIRATIDKNSLEFYNEEIKPLLGSELAEKFCFKEGESFALQGIDFMDSTFCSWL